MALSSDDEAGPEPSSPGLVASFRRRAHGEARGAFARVFSMLERAGITDSTAWSPRYRRQAPPGPGLHNVAVPFLQGDLSQELRRHATLGHDPTPRAPPPKDLAHINRPFYDIWREARTQDPEGAVPLWGADKAERRVEDADSGHSLWPLMNHSWLSSRHAKGMDGRMWADGVLFTMRGGRRLERRLPAGMRAGNGCADKRRTEQAAGERDTAQQGASSGRACPQSLRCSQAELLMNRFRDEAGPQPKQARTDAAAAPCSGARASSAEQSACHVPYKPNLLHLLHSRDRYEDGMRGAWTPSVRRHLSTVGYPPVHFRKEVERRPAKAYIGQYSRNGELFVAAYQDSHIRVFNVDGESFTLRKDVHARRIQWTVTDTALSPDSRLLLYSSINRYVHLVNIARTENIVHSVANITEVHDEHDFMPDEHGAIWSLAWAANSHEVAAGTGLPGLVIYDLSTEAVSSTQPCHDEDVNAVAYLDDSGNVLLSGSDDTCIFLHDRRTMGRAGRRVCESKFFGHTEGVTHLDARGDGRHFISNGKDSTVRLWDVRFCAPGSCEGTDCKGSLSNFDYRWEYYSHSGFHVKRPTDHSLLTFRGHSVLETLIRCYWGPRSSTYGRYVYSGSADGRVVVFDTLTGHMVHELVHHKATVRDCSWHPGGDHLVSVSWDGTIALWGRGAHVPNKQHSQWPVVQSAVP